MVSSMRKLSAATIFVVAILSPTGAATADDGIGRAIVRGVIYSILTDGYYDDYHAYNSNHFHPGYGYSQHNHYRPSQYRSHRSRGFRNAPKRGHRADRHDRRRFDGRGGRDRRGAERGRGGRRDGARDGRGDRRGDRSGRRNRR